MAAYVIVQAEVTEWDKFKEYLKESPGIIAQHGGKYLARGGETVTLEGGGPYQEIGDYSNSHLWRKQRNGITPRNTSASNVSGKAQPRAHSLPLMAVRDFPSLV